MKLLIVDDSAYMAKLLKLKLSAYKEIEIVGIASNGKEAVEKTKYLKPDCITMDINMPVMNGIEAVSRIMNSTPTPIIMVSAYSSKDAALTLKALRCGAVDFVQKPGGEVSAVDSIIDELVTKIRAAISSRARKIAPAAAADIDFNKTLQKKKLNLLNAEYVVGIGVSTGGPALLTEICALLNPNFNAAILISQHMPPKFTGIFAEQLAAVTKLNVEEAKDNTYIKRQSIYICPGNKNMLVSEGKIKLVEIACDAVWKPSIDEMLISIADNYRKKSVAVILTGMGCDGLKGVAVVKAAGGKIICQTPETAALPRMPESVINAGFADIICAPRVIMAKLNHWQKNNFIFEDN